MLKFLSTRCVFFLSEFPWFLLVYVLVCVIGKLHDFAERFTVFSIFICITNCAGSVVEAKQRSVHFELGAGRSTRIADPLLLARNCRSVKDCGLRKLPIE